MPIVTGLANAVDFEFAPDGRIFILNRYGAVDIFNPATQTTTTAATFNVYLGVESGLIGIALDPDFAVNDFLYLYYSPQWPSVNRLSRFTISGNTILTGSESVLLEVPVDRQQGHHDGGNLEFDGFGNLYLGTGDDTWPTEYAALNESDHRFSAEKSSGNTMDLRGKILRIHPNSQGGYWIPSGNLFPSGGGLPEIYVMGARNPYKFEIDSETNWLFWADIGPDAGDASELGPAGKDEINLTKQAGNFGWPHFSGPNLPYKNTYLDYYFDPAAPTNDSTWNTGPRVLPPAEPAWITVSRASYMAGPVYHFDGSNPNSKKLPFSFDNHLFYWDFNTSRVFYAEFDSSGNLSSINEWFALEAPGRGYIDFEIGPDDQLYILEYGSGCCEFDVGNGELHRIDFLGGDGNQSPVASISAEPRSGAVPLEVNFSSQGSFDPDGDPVSFSWDFESDGTPDSFDADVTHTYHVAGTFNAQLKVSDPQGAETFGNVTIHSGNSLPAVDFTSPPAGGLFEWNEFVHVNADVVDAEDGSISDGGIQCGDVEIQPALGHLEHVHDTALIPSCNGQTYLYSDHNNNGEDQLYYQFQGRYTDNGGLTSYKTIQVFPKTFAAQYFDSSRSVEIVPSSDAGFGAVNAVAFGRKNAFVSYQGRNLVGINGVALRVASPQNGLEIQLRQDAANGPLLATLPIPNTGGAGNWMETSVGFGATSGQHDLYLVATGPQRDLSVQVSAISFSGSGISFVSDPPELTSISVSPSSAAVAVGQTQQFTAAGFDQYGNPYAMSPGWSV
ncbi:MAG: carbohydrate-binding protein, partial [Gammaproteobacteria bacterium]|nr:carbohydrate-binding protein [Gammaproteobacteria bacterium]